MNADKARRHVIISVHRWRCPKGHEWEVTGDDFMTVTLSFRGGFAEGYRKKVDSGPLCPFCICDYLRQNFPTSEVEPTYTVGTEPPRGASKEG